MNALGEQPPPQGWGCRIFLHHRAGAADLLADQAACLRQHEIVDRALDLVTFGLVLRHEFARKRGQRGCGCGGRLAMLLAAARICPSAAALSLPIGTADRALRSVCGRYSTLSR